jgi:hypothetical protein
MRHGLSIFARAALVLALLFLLPVLAQAGPTIKFGEEGSLTINYAGQLYFQSRDTGSGADGDSSTTDIFFRRNRLMFFGKIDDTHSFYLAFQQQGDRRIFETMVADSPVKDFDVIDAYYSGDFAPQFRVKAGLLKDQLVREDLEGCFDPLSLDRSLFVYLPLDRLNRDYGVVVWGNLANSKIQYRLAAMKGNDNSDDPKSSLRYTGRVHLTLLDPEDGFTYMGTYLGEKKVFTVGAGYQMESDAVYGNVAAKTLTKDYKAYTYDVFFEYPVGGGAVTASGGYLNLDFDDAYLGGDPDPRSINLNGQKKGWYGKAGYLIPGKLGFGRVQIYGRYEKWDFAELNNVFDQEIKWYAGGLNYLIKGQNLRITLEAAKTNFDKETDSVQDFTTLTAMLQVRF